MCGHLCAVFWNVCKWWVCSTYENMCLLVSNQPRDQHLQVISMIKDIPKGTSVLTWFWKTDLRVTRPLLYHCVIMPPLELILDHFGMCLQVHAHLDKYILSKVCTNGMKSTLESIPDYFGMRRYLPMLMLVCASFYLIIRLKTFETICNGS